MTSSEFQNLVKIRKLKEEPGSQIEFDSLVLSGKRRLEDSRNPVLSFDSRFDLAYNVTHSLSLAALRWHGYRANSRYIVFQVLPHTLGLPPEIWRLMTEAHRRRNQSEYDGVMLKDERFLETLIKSIQDILKGVEELGPVPVH
jgi:hypothetical protein